MNIQDLIEKEIKSQKDYDDVRFISNLLPIEFPALGLDPEKELYVLFFDNKNGIVVSTGFSDWSLFTCINNWSSSKFGMIATNVPVNFGISDSF